jgi:hypothetical protein
VLSACVLSACVLSACLLSACLLSACLLSACLLSAEEHASELVAVVQELVERGGQERVGHPDWARPSR